MVTMLSKLNNYTEIIGSTIVGVFIMLGILIYSTLLNKRKT
jgi:hypothetical protein